MIRHGLDEGNVVNRHRYTRLRSAQKRMKLDGVNLLKTEILEIYFYKTHVRLKIMT